jgi:glycosyltransferase involved in cell wall biosynthesis
LTKKTIAVMATAPLVVKFHLETIIESLKENYSVVVMTNMSGSGDEFLKLLPQGVRFFDTRMERKISIFSDLRTLVLLFIFFKKENISLIFTVSPKAGLLGNIVARIMGIPIRIHTFTGQVWQTKRGIFRLMLMLLDKVTYLCCSKVLVDSYSQRNFLIANSIVKPKSSLVLGHGSLCGVDTVRFSPNTEARENIRKKLQVKTDDVVFLFVGRLDLDKGIVELLEAYSKLFESIDGTSLLLVGPSETEVDDLKALVSPVCLKSIHFLPYSSSPELYMAAADVFCLPSHREGFGTVIIESAACGIPAIGTKIYGLSDSIVDCQTGLLVNIGDVVSLRNTMHDLATDKQLRLRLGNSARVRARELFDQRIVVPRLIEFLDTELAEFECQL